MSAPDRVVSAFSWLALSTSDVEAAGRFYGQVFGWMVAPAPVGAFLVTREGTAVGTLLDHRQNAFAKKEPVNWLPFVRVPSIESSMREVEERGGKVWIAPYSVGVAQVAVIRGATGEAFALWETPTVPGATPVLNDPGVAVWFELATREPERATAFYRHVFSWQIAEEGGYTFIGNESGQFGGIVKLAGDWEDWAFMAAIGRVKGEKMDVPPHWMIFFAVDDCEMVVEQAEELGAMILTHPEPLHTVGTMAILRDPQGVYFSVLSKR